MFLFKGQPPPEGGEGEKAEDRKQKENTAYAKKMVLRLAGFMGVGGAVAIVYIFGESLSFVLCTQSERLCCLS